MDTGFHPPLKARFRPVFDRIAAGAVARETARLLPHEPIRWLKEAGFAALRVPLAQGGAGATLPELFDLLIDLATADSNIAQALRGHLAFVEDILGRPEAQARWFPRFVAGEIVGNAWTEIGAVKQGERLTRLTDGRIDGQKYYSTGAIFAEWIDVLADHDGAAVIAAVDTRQAGVVLSDDWRGFGQRTTGSGTTTFTGAVADQVFPFESRFAYQTALYQTVLNAVLAGAARAAVRDAAEVLRNRKRAYSHGAAQTAAQDPQLLAVIGRAHAQAEAARAITLTGAEALQRASLSPSAETLAEAELASARAQSAAAALAQSATAGVFDALSASATDAGLALDRHWRNARIATNHNPLVYKERILGDHVVNATLPPTIWQIGTPDAAQGKTSG